MDKTTKMALIVSCVLVVFGLVGIFSSSDELIKVLSGVATILGLFGGIPGIKQLFFENPRIITGPFMPAVIFDDGYTIESRWPKFSLAGLVRVHNPSDKDVAVTEMRLDGRTQDTSGRYKFPDGKPILYDLHISGTLDGIDTPIKSHSSAVLGFRFAHFENTQKPGEMNGPMSGGMNPEAGQIVFTIVTPSFNQLFKYNEQRIPGILVDEASNANLTFSILFNNERVAVKDLLNLQHFSKEEWEDKEKLISTYNAAVSLSLRPK
jgi:hypothetical protein